MSRAAKGSQFERFICVLLSEWWSSGLGGEKRSDVFWRSSQSGGRATQRAKSGKATAGSYGDIACIDPIGEPLLKMFSIELKRGSSIGTPWDLFDTKPTKAIRLFEAAIAQAIRSHEQAKSEGWLLICRRDHRRAVVYTDISCLDSFPGFSSLPLVRMQCHFNGVGELRLVAFYLEDFLHHISPKGITEVMKLL